MKYDFTTIIDRHDMDALAVDYPPGKPRDGFDLIPMWVADMNFATAPSIPEAIIERTKHACYGYFIPRDEYFDAIINWQKERNGAEDLERKHIGYANGVLGGVVSALNVMCSKGDNVLVHSPTYVGFTHALGDNGYNIVHSPMYVDEDDIWRMDFEDMERKIVEHKIHAAIFCSPHNPCGRVWERWEIEKAMELFKKYDVYVISDEIWSDLILPGHKHIPTQSVSEDAKMRTVAMYAPSKTFNLAGLVGSYRIIYNSWLRDRVDKEATLSHYNGQNVLSQYALIGGYSKVGAEWLGELCRVIEKNVELACCYVDARFGGVKVCRPQGTYMLFLDCTGWCQRTGKTMDDILKAAWDVGVALQDGRAFHGDHHLRVNVALPTERVREAFERLDQYIFNA